ncbi:alpha/beta fold hydrolase [Pseudonocardia nigra]|uniref:alpha/beta fold hydrolase n=1 Tax=Pseudonocardia nigra TaxID=1921578 RepID=UPI0027E27641|nr:alpha/beta fold hydrolase [Pseudonocardia nigra]
MTERVHLPGIDVLVAGAGAPVLLLHGIGGAAEAFTPQLTGLADRHRVIAWDAPGYGGSADPLPSADLDHYADEALRVLRALDAEPAHVVGVSWGGVIATRLALRHPGAVRSLTLADSSRGSGRTAAGRRGMARRVEDLAALGPRAFAHLRGPALVAPGGDPAPVLATMSRVRLPGYTAAAASMAATDHSGNLGRIDVPTLVLVGEHDTVTGVAESRALAAGIPGARFALVPAAGHAANQEQPERFDAALGAFLADVDALAPAGAR